MADRSWTLWEGASASLEEDFRRFSSQIESPAPRDDDDSSLASGAAPPLVAMLEGAAALANEALVFMGDACVTARPVTSWQLRLHASCILVDLMEGFLGRSLQAAERDARKAFFADHVTNVDVILLALPDRNRPDGVTPQMVAAGDVRQVASLVRAVCGLVLGRQQRPSLPDPDDESPFRDTSAIFLDPDLLPPAASPGAAADLQEELQRDLEQLGAYLTRTGDLSGGSAPAGGRRHTSSVSAAASAPPSGWVSPPNEVVITFGGDTASSASPSSSSSSDVSMSPPPRRRRRLPSPSPTPSPPRPDPAETERQARLASAAAARRVRERRAAEAARRAEAEAASLRRARGAGAAPRRRPRRASSRRAQRPAAASAEPKKKKKKKRESLTKDRRALVREWLDAAERTDYASAPRDGFNRHRALDCQLDAKPQPYAVAERPMPRPPTGTVARPLESERVGSRRPSPAAAGLPGSLLREHEERVRRILLSGELRRRNKRAVSASRAWQHLLREFREARAEQSLDRREARSRIGRRLEDLADSVENHMRNVLDTEGVLVVNGQG